MISLLAGPTRTYAAWHRYWSGKTKARPRQGDSAGKAADRLSRGAVEGDQFTVVTDSRRLAKYWPLVEQLGHASAIVRQDATRQLIEAGKDALTIVRLAESCADPQASRAGAQYIETCIQVNCLLADLASRNGETRRRALLQLEVLANSAQRDVVQDLLRGELEEMSPHMRPVIAGILKNNP